MFCNLLALFFILFKILNFIFNHLLNLSLTCPSIHFKFKLFFCRTLIIKPSDLNLTNLVNIKSYFDLVNSPKGLVNAHQCKLPNKLVHLCNFPFSLIYVEFYHTLIILAVGYNDRCFARNKCIPFNDFLINPSVGFYS